MTSNDQVALDITDNDGPVLSTPDTNTNPGIPQHQDDQVTVDVDIMSPHEDDDDRLLSLLVGPRRTTNPPIKYPNTHQQGTGTITIAAKKRSSPRNSTSTPDNRLLLARSVGIAVDGSGMPNAEQQSGSNTINITTKRRSRSNPAMKPSDQIAVNVITSGDSVGSFLFLKSPQSELNEEPLRSEVKTFSPFSDSSKKLLAKKRSQSDSNLALKIPEKNLSTFASIDRPTPRRKQKRMISLSKSQTYPKSHSELSRMDSEKSTASQKTLKKERLFSRLISVRPRNACPALRNPEGTTLAFRNLRVSVPIKYSGIRGMLGAKTGLYKDILCGVSGICRPGELIFLMGPSGCGKTTLLDSLANRVSLPVRGTQTLNGVPKTEHEIKMQAKYVQQHDVLYGSLTTRETLEYAAKFYQTDLETRTNIVDQALFVLGLKEHQNVKVGNAFFRGLSGGQQRRVSVGCELVAKPAIMFLDEPTSGLDSTTAFKLMKVLQNLARESNSAIICSIHQPGQSTFEIADKLILLSKGRQMYYGNTKDVVSYFQSIGFDFPERTSTAEHVIDLVNTDYADTTIENSAERCAEAWPKSEYYKRLMAQLESMAIYETPDPGPEGGEQFRIIGYLKAGSLKYQTSLLNQTWTLTHRGLTNMSRDPSAVWLRMLIYFVLSLMIGTVWLRLPQSADQIQNFAGMLFFTIGFTIMLSIAVLPAYILEHSMLMKEKANGAYRVTAFTISNFITGAPFMLLMAIMVTFVVYWLVGLRNSGDAFFIFVAAQFVALVVAESLMFLLSAIFPLFILGIAASAFIYGLFMIVQGFMISLDDIGWWWRWAQYISIHFYTFNIMMQNQFAASEVYTASPPQFPSNLTGSQIVEAYDFNNISIGASFGALVAMIFIYRLAAGMILSLFYRGKK